MEHLSSKQASILRALLWHPHAGVFDECKATLINQTDDHHRGSDDHLRAILAHYELKRLTTQVAERLQDVIAGSYPYVEKLLKS